MRLFWLFGRDSRPEPGRLLGLFAGPKSGGLEALRRSDLVAEHVYAAEWVDTALPFVAGRAGPPDQAPVLGLDADPAALLGTFDRPFCGVALPGAVSVHELGARE